MLPAGSRQGGRWPTRPVRANDRPRVGCIGNGGMGKGDARAIKKYGDILAFCDVDRKHAEAARDDEKIGKGKADIYEDYRKLLDRNDIDAVTIGTPDHWHTKIAIDALRAGKDVYCEKPLTLTIDEGKQLCAGGQGDRARLPGRHPAAERGPEPVPAPPWRWCARAGSARSSASPAPSAAAPSSKPFVKTAPPEGSTGTCGWARRRRSTTSRSAATASSAGGTSTRAAR